MSTASGPRGMVVPLQPLRVSMGWVVEYNTLHEIDPDSPSLPDKERRLFFSQDLLQFHHPRYNRLVDVGWYPHGDLEAGAYGLVVYEGDFRGRLLHEYSSRPRAGWRTGRRRRGANG